MTVAYHLNAMTLPVMITCFLPDVMITCFRCELAEVPPGLLVGMLPALRYLDLSNNKISSLDTASGLAGWCRCSRSDSRCDGRCDNRCDSRCDRYDRRDSRCDRR